MDESNKTDSQTLEYLYKEYVRLAELGDSHLKGEQADCKPVAAIGLLLAWKPITDLTSASSTILLLGFIAILFISSIVGIRAFLKDSFIQYCGYQMGFYEEVIRKHLNCSEPHIFQFSTDWSIGIGKSTS
jgi:hypothetical protein